MTLAPYDAVVLLSYGGPDGPADVLPFLRNATAGRGIPDDRLREVGAHYELFGGVSPINARNAELVSALGDALRERGADVPVVVGNRNWHPFLTDTFADLAEQGARRVLCVLTSAYASYSGCRQYREDIAGVLRTTGLPIEVDKIGPYAETPGFVSANADALAAAVRELAAGRAVDAALGDGRPGGERPRGDGPNGERPHVLFVTHSIPLAMETASGPGPQDQRYSAQHLRVAGAVHAAAGERLAATGAEAELGDWDLVFCSRSGPPQVPWLEPDVNQAIRALAADGVREIVVAPIGFVSDHMEVVYDLDTEAAATAREVGVRMVRAATAGVHPAFVAELAAQIVRRAEVARAGGEPEPGGVGVTRYRCGDSCCASGRPGPAKPAAC